MLGARSEPTPPHVLLWISRMRKAGRANLRLIHRADGESKESRAYNLQGGPEAECVIADATEGIPRDIAIARNVAPFWPINESHPYYHPLSYDPMRPRGEHEWSYAITHTMGYGEVSAHQFASRRLIVRRATNKEVRLFGNLPRRYICDIRSKVDHHRFE